MGFKFFAGGGIMSSEQPKILTGKDRPHEYRFHTADS